MTSNLTANPLPHSDAPLPMRDAVNIAFRPFEVTDRGFILKSWLKCHRRNHAGVSDDDYFEGQTHLIFALASKSRVIVACDADKPEFILGFICGRMAKNMEDLILDYVYVKEPYRRNSIARDLVCYLGYRQLGRIIATHWSRAVIPIASHYPIQFNPFINTIGALDV